MKAPLFLDVYVFEGQRQRGSANSFDYSSCPHKLLKSLWTERFLVNLRCSILCWGVYSQKKTHRLRGQSSLVSSSFLQLTRSHISFFSTMQSSSKASYKPYSRRDMILHRSGTPGRGTAVPWAYTGKHVTQRAATPPHCLLGAQGRPFHCLSISAYSGTLEPTAFPLRWSDCYFEFCSL